MHHAGADAAAAPLVGESVAVLARIAALERRELALQAALAERLGAGHLVALRPLHLDAADDLLHRLRRGDRVAVAVLHALHAAVADVPRVDGIRLQLGVRQHDREALARTELRREERARIAELAESGEEGRHAEVDRHVRRGQAGAHRTAPARAEVPRERVHRLAAAHVRHGHGLVAVVLHEAVHLPQDHRPVDGVERGVAHRGVVEVVRALLHAAQAAARDAEAEHDHGLRVGEDVAGIVLPVRPLPSAHGRDADDVGAALLCLGLHLGRCQFCFVGHGWWLVVSG